MKMKIMKLVAMLASVAIVAGCGDKKTSESDGTSKSEASTPQAKHEKIVKEFCSIIKGESGKSSDEADKFVEDNFSQSFLNVCGRKGEKEYGRKLKKSYRAMAESKESVTTSVLKTFEEAGSVMASAIEAKCGDTALYFIVGKEGKDKPDQILGITSSKEEALRGGN